MIQIKPEKNLIGNMFLGKKFSAETFPFKDN